MSVNLTVPARDRLQALTLNQQARAGRRLPMSAVLLAALDIAEAYPDELAARIDQPEGESE